MEPHRELTVQGHLETDTGAGAQGWSQRVGHPHSLPPILSRAWALTLMLLRLAFSGLAQVSGLWPPGSRLQAASENLWLEKVLASPIAASPSPTLHGLSRYRVLPPTSPAAPPAAAGSLPPPFVFGQGNSPQLPLSLPADLAYLC